MTVFRSRRDRFAGAPEVQRVRKDESGYGHVAAQMHRIVCRRSSLANRRQSIQSIQRTYLDQSCGYPKGSALGALPCREGLGGEKFILF
ncbi:hypothetical protein DFQ01_11220 [Paenibacillus cellulosilyticus]|uniref:Uncharacterized protein n=1 Tax=Paenibacillus cellulosilyticus TaxID=375489 RepID=A0A2V2YRJ1_9BACL|nr:hypothetical protein DFQ01_11220 [Paenibacillus cellulosilyticus]